VLSATILHFRKLPRDFGKTKPDPFVVQEQVATVNASMSISDAMDFNV
jgi:hypothetical protein